MIPIKWLLVNMNVEFDVNGEPRFKIVAMQSVIVGCPTNNDKASTEITIKNGWKIHH